jgi:cytochrome c-type biogenesis protein CcmE
MIEDAVQPVFDLARKALPLGLVGMWSAIAVVAAVILMRLRDESFGYAVGAALFAIGGVALVLLCASVRNVAPSYRRVDEVVAEPQTSRIRRMPVQVHGRVVPGSIERRLGTDEYRFRMESVSGRPPAALSVRYAGLVPDTFRSGAEIIATGTVVGDGGLDVVPDGIMAKCPTMYWPPPDSDWQSSEPGS